MQLHSEALAVAESVPDLAGIVVDELPIAFLERSVKPEDVGTVRGNLVRRAVQQDHDVLGHARIPLGNQIVEPHRSPKLGLHSLHPMQG